MFHIAYNGLALTLLGLLFAGGLLTTTVSAQDTCDGESFDHEVQPGAHACGYINSPDVHDHP